MRTLFLITLLSGVFFSACTSSIDKSKNGNCIILFDSTILQKKIVVQLSDHDTLYVLINNDIKLTKFIGKRDSSFSFENAIYVKDDLTRKVSSLVSDSILIFTVPYISEFRREELFAFTINDNSIHLLKNNTSDDYSLTSEFGYFIIDTSRKIIQCTYSEERRDGEFKFTPIDFYRYSANGFVYNHSAKIESEYSDSSYKQLARLF